MKTSASLAIACLLSVAAARAAITVPGADGSDGVLNITANTVIDLAQAVPAAWDANNTANAGKGVYDAGKWAVVFKYSSVTVATGATVTFTNHPSRAPVVWLVSGNVSIAGNVSVDGGQWAVAPLLAEPGPGGFRGGMASYSTGPKAGAGFGPGGGFQQNNAGYSGGYGTVGTGGALAGQPYGNPSLVPLIGGSGGAGDQEFTTNREGGGGGGGALLIACTGTVTIGGEVRANGGAGRSVQFNVDAGGGSGGGIRIVCSDLVGAGRINATGGSGWQIGGLGRIRVERVVNTNTLQIIPDPSVVPLAANDTALLWPPADAPEVKIVSVGGAAAPADPRASFGSAGADVALPETATTQVVIETTNVEQASQVQVRLTPRANANATVINAAVQTVVSTTPLVVRWTATLPVAVGYSAVQVKVVRP
jgi:plastocyanin